MPDKPWKHEERQAARLIGGRRHPANSGGRIDAEASGIVVQVKHVGRLSLAQLEALAVEADQLGAQRGKVGAVVVKRRAGRGKTTPRLVVMTETAYRAMHIHAERQVMASPQDFPGEGPRPIGPAA